MELRTIAEGYDFFQEYLRRFKLDNYTLDVVKVPVQAKTKRAVASCNWFHHKFEIVEFYLTHLNTLDLEQVILHEIAHALTPGHGHDQYFKSVARRIGAIPEAKADFSYLTEKMPKYLKPKLNYVYECPVCHNLSYYGRKLKNSYSCGKCSNKFDRRFILVFKEKLS